MSRTEEALARREWAEAEISDITFDRISTTRSKLFIAYPIFSVITTLLAVFFLASLVLALTSSYFLDWGSALVGFMGTAGLVVVGWFSRLQTRS